MKPDTIADVLNRLEERPDDAELFQLLGRLYLEEGRLKEARAAYERSLALDPCDPFTHLYLGNWCWRCGKHKEALERFQYAAELSPDLAVAYWCQGDIHQAQGQFDLAEAAYRKAVEVDPNDPQARRKLSEWYEFRFGSDWEQSRG
jgi:Flp pilus assembly protein TadD